MTVESYKPVPKSKGVTVSTPKEEPVTVGDGNITVIVRNDSSSGCLKAFLYICAGIGALVLLSLLCPFCMAVIGMSG